MQKELNEEQKKFLERTMKHRKEKVEGLAYSALAIALKQDIPVFDLPYYVLQRARQIIEEAFSKVDFKNEKVIKARHQFLKECLASLRNNIAVAPIKEQKDETDKRDNQCEPIAQDIVKMLLADELIFSDEEYFNEILANEESIPLSAAIGGYANALDEKLLMIISEHWSRGNTKLWHTEKENVTFRQLNEILQKE